MTTGATLASATSGEPRAGHGRRAAGGERFTLYDIDWPTYRTLADGLRGRHVRVTYDRGDLELMTISPTHGRLSRLLARLVLVLAEETGKPLLSFGDMTCEREDLARALEPDECFYIDNEHRVRASETLDLAVDPPPDLAIEVDVSRSSRSRMPIYAALGVPEVWRYDHAGLGVHRLAPSGEYEPASTSRYFGDIPIAELGAFLDRRTEIDEVALLREARRWVRARLEASKQC